MDLIDRQAAIMGLIFSDCTGDLTCGQMAKILYVIKALPSVQPKLSCEGCKHLGKWENEVEYGYSSPCTRCKRRVEDHYER